MNNGLLLNKRHQQVTGIWEDRIKYMSIYNEYLGINIIFQDYDGRNTI